MNAGILLLLLQPQLYRPHRRPSGPPGKGPSGWLILALAAGALFLILLLALNLS